MRKSLVTFCVAGFATAAIGAAPVARQPASTASGVYTEAQAAEGAALYSAQCAMCHGERLEGTLEIPALKGKFIAGWSRSPVADLYHYVSRAMPQPAPGSLSPEDNARIVAFLLQQNGMPAGKSALPADAEALSTIMFMPAEPAR